MYNKLGKIEPIINRLTEQFELTYHLNEHLSIDEAMIPCKGRSSLKQYMPLKPIKRGFKVWVLADATNGYISRLQVYTGKSGTTTEDGLGGTIVKNLCKDIQHK
jgi:hypothetical protein